MTRILFPVLSCALCSALLGCGDARESQTSNDEAGGAGGADAAVEMNSAGSTAEVEPPLNDIRARCDSSFLAPPMLRRLTRRELENSIRDTFPAMSEAWPGVALGPDPLSPLRFKNDANTLLVGEQTAREILTTAKEVASLVASTAYLPTILPCAATASETCAVEFIDTFAPRLYRRPLTAEERDELGSYNRSVTARSDFSLGIKWTLVALLESPAFLYRSELGDDSGKLNQYEIASEIAFTYGGSTPSPELLAKASRAELSTSEAIATEAAVALETTRGQEALREFFREWAGYERVMGTDKALATNFINKLAPLLAEETRRFIDAVVLDKNGNVKDLLTTNTTFLDQTLAQFYGYGDEAIDFSPIERPLGSGIGLLAQASFLAGRAHFDYTSPVFRGLFIYSQLLCRKPLERPAVVPTLDGTPTANTTRQRFENMHAQGACASCHQLFEPLGYALERFDATGRLRQNENGYPLDTHAIITLDDSTTLEFDGLEDLAHQLAELPEVTDCVSGLMTSYVFGGAGGKVCLAEEARTKIAHGEIGLRDFYLQLAKAPSFSLRAR